METIWRERTALLLNLRSRQRRLGMILAQKSFDIFLALKSISSCLADHMTLFQIYSQRLPFGPKPSSSVLAFTPQY
jgi:hypothetical protein